jgi:hypothetical protein
MNKKQEKGEKLNNKNTPTQHTFFIVMSTSAHNRNVDNTEFIVLSYLCLECDRGKEEEKKQAPTHPPTQS